MSENAWEPIEMEMAHGDYLLRVRRTHSPNRVLWFVVPVAEVKKAPHWFYATPGKGASEATAKGYSRTFEDAKRDVIAMADVLSRASR